jgi:hypothetical protein
MKSNARWVVALAVISGACFNGALSSKADSSDEAAEAAAMMKNAEAEQRAAAAARAKDPAWKPACTEVGQIQIGDSKNPGALKNFCLNAEGNILACYAPLESSKSSQKAGAIRVYSPAGKLLKTMPLEIGPGAICVAKDGSIFVAGDGRVLKLNSAGKVLASGASPVAGEPVVIGEEIEEMIKQSKRPLKEEMARMKTTLEQRRADVTGLAVTDQDVFMAVPAPSEFTYRVYRFDHTLVNAKLVVEKLRGCCGQMDVQAHDRNLWIPHNARHTVESHDRDGKELSKFGKAGRVKATDFGGCCEPKSMRVLSNGDVLVAESGPPTCIKRFSAAGKFMGVVAVTDAKGDCVRVTVEQSPDQSRYYLLDTTRDAIRIFKAKS